MSLELYSLCHHQIPAEENFGAMVIRNSLYEFLTDQGWDLHEDARMWASSSDEAVLRFRAEGTIYESEDGPTPAALEFERRRQDNAYRLVLRRIPAPAEWHEPS